MGITSWISSNFIQQVSNSNIQTSTYYLGNVSVTPGWYAEGSLSLENDSYKDVNDLVKNIFDILNRLNNNKVNSYELKSLVSMIRDVKKIRSEKIAFEKLTEEERASMKLKQNVPRNQDEKGNY